MCVRVVCVSVRCVCSRVCSPVVVCMGVCVCVRVVGVWVHGRARPSRLRQRTCCLSICCIVWRADCAYCSFATSYFEGAAAAFDSSCRSRLCHNANHDMHEVTVWPVACASRPPNNNNNYKKKNDNDNDNNDNDNNNDDNDDDNNSSSSSSSNNNSSRSSIVENVQNQQQQQQHYRHGR